MKNANKYSQNNKFTLGAPYYFNEKRSDHIRSLGSQAKLRASLIQETN